MAREAENKDKSKSSQGKGEGATQYLSSVKDDDSVSKFNTWHNFCKTFTTAKA